MSFLLPKSVSHIAFDEFFKHSDEYQKIIDKWQLKEQDDCLFMLGFENKRLALYKRDEPKQGAIVVDFASGGLNHRRQFGGGRGEAIVKACGIKGDYLPTVIDATAGLGKDAFVLASVGCKVTLLERHPVVAALLENGLIRAYQDAEIGHWIQERMQQIYPDLTNPSSEHTLLSLCPHEVVYLDPMYPHPSNKKQTALVKKEMRSFQSLVGEDNDADNLLTPALKIASKRVVVKRPDHAPFLNNIKADGAIKTKNHRFDIYSIAIRKT